MRGRSCEQPLKTYLVPETLKDVFTSDDWFAPVERPAKRRKVDLTGEETASLASLLKSYFTVTRFTIRLVSFPWTSHYSEGIVRANKVISWHSQVFAGSVPGHDFDENNKYDEGARFEEREVPVKRLHCSRQGTNTSITLQTKSAERRSLTLLTALIDSSEDLPFRSLASLCSIHNVRVNDPQPILFDCNLRRSSENDHTYIMEAAIFMRDSIDIPGRLHASVNTLLNKTFPALKSPLREESFSPSEFYSSVHVTSKHATPSIHSQLLRCSLFPFQRRAVQWLLDREGASLQTDGEVVSRTSGGEKHLPPSFHETQDADGRLCFASPYLRVLTSDVSDCWNAHLTLKGGILAEEMGLGKTVEIISLICLHTRERGRAYGHHDLVASDGRRLIESGATLIVTPSVILAQWRYEFEKHAPELMVFFYEGINRHEESSEKELLHKMAEYDVVLTTYNILRGEIHYSEDPPDRFFRLKKKNPPRRSPLVQISWWRVCLDEAQMVESGVSNSARVARVIPRVNAWAITGTPLKKDMNDLFGLLLFLHYEPFCSSPELFRRLYKSFKPLFKDIIGRIALRHSKDQVREELQLPQQKRFVIRIPFTAVEEQNYRHLFTQMCDDCGLDSDGGPLRGDWDPNDRVTIEKMRKWLTRLRRTCLYSELSSGPIRVTGTLGSAADSPLRSVAEVLESMIESAGVDMFLEQKKLLMSMIRRGQLLENALQPRKALAVWKAALEFVKPLVADYRGQLNTGMNRRREMKKKEGKEQQNQISSSHDEDDHDDDDGGNDNIQKVQKDRLQGLHARLRSALELQHVCTFFIGNAYFQIKSNTEITKPESEEYLFLEKSETKAYEEAKQMRKELLQEISKEVNRNIDTLRANIQSKNLAMLPEMRTDVEEIGFESQRLADRVLYFCETMNHYAKLYSEWRDNLLRLLLAGLVDQEDDAELEGDEYEVSAKDQDELVVYMEALRILNAYRCGAITGQRNELIAHDVAQGLAMARDGQGPSPELYLRLIQKCDKFEGFDPLRTILSDLRDAISSLEWQSDSKGNRAYTELLILRPLYAQAVEMSAAQYKAFPRLEQELRFLTRVMNKRLEFYRQLQQISDMVAPYEEGTKGKALDERVYEQVIQTEAQMESRISSLKSKYRYLIHLRDDSGTDEDSRFCVICQSAIEIGVLTVCGHKYCKYCYDLWWRAHRTCPTCKRKLASTESHPIVYKPMELVAEEERPPESRGDSSTVENPIYTNVSHGVLNEVMSTRLEHSYGTKIDTIAKHLIWLRHHDPGSRSVVFSQYRSFIIRLSGAFRKFGIGYSTVDATGAGDRFQRSASTECILIHSKSQASGLNLTKATHIFLCEPLINTAIELQAIARIHRIGQRNETTVWMYIVSDSVEESIYDISVRRRLEHIARRTKSNFSKTAPASKGQTRLMEDAIDSANSLELQDNLTQNLTDPVTEGEQVPQDDLWQCLFGNPKKSAAANDRRATGEVDRVVRANAAESRGRVSSQ
ncbi:hypothetical protein KEM54_000189 [Ascosphaera aggregata]|nr:hypothetical protein KEM54_000189 [Ascosphaera aggregata]